MAIDEPITEPLIHLENPLNSIIAQRIDAIRKALISAKLDALMVSVQENRFYLSGFTGEDTQFDESAGVLIITERDLILATDSRFELQARDEAIGYDIVCYKKGLDQELPGIIAPLGIRHLGFESIRLSHKNYAAYVQTLTNNHSPVTLVPTTDLVENLRQIKSEAEIEHTLGALRLAEKAFDQGPGQPSSGNDRKTGGLVHGKSHAGDWRPGAFISCDRRLGSQQCPAPCDPDGSQTETRRTDSFRLGCQIPRILLRHQPNGNHGATRRSLQTGVHDGGRGP